MHRARSPFTLVITLMLLFAPSLVANQRIKVAQEAGAADFVNKLAHMR